MPLKDLLKKNITNSLFCRDFLQFSHLPSVKSEGWEWMRYFSLEDLENQVVNNFQVDSLTFLELRSANAIRLTIDKTNVVCVPPDPFCHFTNLLSKFHLYVFAWFFLFKGLVLYVFGYCPYLLLVLVQKRSWDDFRSEKNSLIGQEIGILEIRVWQSVAGLWETLRGFGRKRNNSFNKKTTSWWKNIVFLEVAVNFSRFVGCYELVASRNFWLLVGVCLFLRCVSPLKLCNI